MNYVILESIIKSLVPIAIAVVLPIIMAWLSYRNKQHETDKRSEIVTAIIEKNPDIDVQEFLDKLNPPKKPYKEQLMTKNAPRTTLGNNLLYRWYHNHFSYDNSEHLASFY